MLAVLDRTLVRIGRIVGRGKLILAMRSVLARLQGSLVILLLVAAAREQSCRMIVRSGCSCSCLLVVVKANDIFERVGRIYHRRHIDLVDCTDCRVVVELESGSHNVGSAHSLLLLHRQAKDWSAALATLSDIHLVEHTAYCMGLGCCVAALHPQRSHFGNQAGNHNCPLASADLVTCQIQVISLLHRLQPWLSWNHSLHFHCDPNGPSPGHPASLATLLVLPRHVHLFRLSKSA